jgi:hypothetical protein
MGRPDATAKLNRIGIRAAKETKFLQFKKELNGDYSAVIPAKAGIQCGPLDIISA